jgi:hypothetical protein
MGGVISKPISSAITAVTGAKTFGEAAAQVTGQKPITPSPTTSEVSQATATDATGLKRRRRGRSATILTGAAGVQEGATLGTPTLLG